MVLLPPVLIYWLYCQIGDYQKEEVHLGPRSSYCQAQVLGLERDGQGDR